MHSDGTWQLFSKNGEPIAGAGWPAAKDNPKEGDTATFTSLDSWLFERRIQ